MRYPVSTRSTRAERRARATQGPLRGRAKPAARWRDSSTGRITSALAPPGDRTTYPLDEGLS